MYGAKYVWLFPGWYNQWFWKVRYPSVDCTPEELETFLEGSLTFLFNHDDPENAQGISGMTASRFRERLETVVHPSIQGGRYEAPTTYDTVWTIAMGLNKTLTELIETGKIQL